MKRGEVVAGAEYATDLGVHVRVEPEPPAADGSTVTVPSAGWSVQDGAWVQVTTTGQRKMRSGVYKSYLSNVAVRAVEVDTKTKVVIEPRRLICSWPEHLLTLAETREQTDNTLANAQALTARAAALKVTIKPDIRRREARVSFTDMDTLLRKAKV